MDETDKIIKFIRTIQKGDYKEMDKDFIISIALYCRNKRAYKQHSESIYNAIKDKSPEAIYIILINGILLCPLPILNMAAVHIYFPIIADKLQIP